MKKQLKAAALLVLTLGILLTSMTLPAAASSSATDPSTELRGTVTDVQYLPDGGYIETRVFQDQTASAALLSGSVSPMSTYTVSGGKQLAGYDADGTVNWVFTEYGTFFVNSGVSVTCTNDSCTAAAYNGWSYDAPSSSHTSLQAIGNCVFRYKILGITINKNTAIIYVSCDTNGNIY